MLTMSKMKSKDFMNAFKGKENVTEDELQTVVEKKNYKIFEGEVILHLLEGIVLIPMNGNEILIQQTMTTTDEHIQDKRDFVEKYENKMKVYEYILQNQTEIFKMDVEEKVTFDELEKWYDAFYQENYRGPMECELEEYPHEDGIFFDLQHNERYKGGCTYFFIQDGLVEMRYEIKNDEKCYEWPPVLQKEEYVNHLEKDLERAISKEGIQTLTYIVEYFKNKSK